MGIQQYPMPVSVGNNFVPVPPPPPTSADIQPQELNFKNAASIPTESVDPQAHDPYSSTPQQAAPSRQLSRFKKFKRTLLGLNGVQTGLFFSFILFFMFGLPFASGFGYLYGLLAVGILLGIVITAVGTACGIELKWWWFVTFVMVSVCGYSGGMAVGALYPGFLRVDSDTFVLDTVLDASESRGAYAVRFSNDVAVDTSVWGEADGKHNKMDICKVVAPLRDAGAPTGASQVTAVVAVCAINKPCLDGGVDHCLAWFSDPKNVKSYGAARHDSPVIPYNLVNYYGQDHDEEIADLRTKMDPGTVPASVLVFRMIDWESEQNRKKVGCIVAAAVCLPFGLLFVVFGARHQHRHFERLKALPPLPPGAIDVDYDSD